MPSTIARLDRGRFQRLARIFSRDHGVQVELRGFTPCAVTDGKGPTTIYIPVNADHLSDADQQVLEGLLDHEASHVREQREAEERQKSGVDCLTPHQQVLQCKDKTEKLLLNCFEDVRIENNARSRWPGMADNLAATVRHYVEVQRKGIEEGGLINSWSLVGSIIAYGARGDYLGWLPSEAEPLVDLLAPEIEAAKHTKCVEDCYRLTLQTIEKLRDRDMEEAEEPEPPEGEPSEDGNRGDSDGDSNPADQHGNSAGNGDDDKGDEDDAGGSGGDGTDDDGGGNGDGDEDDDQDGDGGGFPSQPQNRSPGERRRAFQNGLQGESDLEDLADKLRERIEQHSTQDVTAHRDRWAPNPDAVELDHWATPHKRGSSEYQAISDRVRPQVSVMRSRLRVQLQTDAEDHIEGDKEGGSVDAATLYSLRLGNKRIFSRRIPGDVLDTAVSMLIDQSGSMHERCKYTRAAESAIALGETLDSFAIPFEVVGFDNDYDHRVEREGPYTRYAPFNYVVYKSFAERYKNVRERFAGIYAGAYNIDGEAVLAVARRLAVRPEQRKIMFVLSDGIPHGGMWEHAPVVVWHLGEAVRIVARSGIEIYGIGIDSDCVEEFYTPKNGSAHVVVEDIDELATQVVKLLSGSLMRRAA